MSPFATILSASSLVSLLALGIGCAPPPTAQTDDDPFGPLEWMIAPTQGRPALLRGGQQFPVVFRAPAGFAGGVKLELINAADPSSVLTLHPADPVRVAPVPPPLKDVDGKPPEEPPVEPAATAVVEVPEDAPAGLYDLRVTVLEGEGKKARPVRGKLLPRAVSIYARFGAGFRFVHLGNMNVGDAAAPDFSDALVEEVNRIAPAFILTTGGYLDPAVGRDDPESWRRIKQYFARFDAPVFLTLGDGDNREGFARFVAPSASGQFRFGGCHGILLYDTYSEPIDRDPAQFMWLDGLLERASGATFHLLVGANDSLRIFDALRRLGHSPGDYVRRHGIGLMFVGGYSDWDYIEHAARLADVPVHYIRTHAASTTLTGRASGVPHYRIVRIEQRRPCGPVRASYVVPENGPVQRAQHSVPVGQLQVSFDGPNDGSAEMLRVTVLNRLTVPIGQLRVKVNLKRTAGEAVAVGGTIERVIEAKDRRTRQVWLRIDCPDLAVASAVVGHESQRERMPAVPAGLGLQFLGDPVLTYRPARGADGFAYYATDGQIQLQIFNEGGRSVQVRPVVRLNGNRLGFRDVPPEEAVEVAPGQRRTLAVNTPLALASPGEHWLTVHLPDDPLPFLTCRPVTLRVEP